MLRQLFQSLLGFVSGYLFIVWMPISFPFSVNDFIVELVLNPLQFLGASIAFVIGFAANGGLVKLAIQKTTALFKQKNVSAIEILGAYSSFIGFYILFYIGFWQTVGFFSFSFIYGMILLDYK